MAAEANQVFWGFWAYVKRNPFKTFGGMTLEDFDAMRDLFIAENSTSLSATPDYEDCNFPGGIQAADTAVAANQANYPERNSM